MKPVLFAAVLLAVPAFTHAGGAGNFDFEAGPPGWIPQKGMAVAIDTQVKHAGQRSLKISGRWQGREMWYASSANFPVGSIKPSTRYRFQGWVYVDSAKPAHWRPAFWVRTAPKGYNGGKMLITPSYDVTRLRTWQRLEIEFQTTHDAETGYWAVLRGSTDTRPSEAVIYVDDISLEEMPFRVNVPRAPANVRIDGQLDEWRLASPVPLSPDMASGAHKPAPALTDVAGLIYMHWDSTHLYVAGWVVDDRLVPGRDGFRVFGDWFNVQCVLGDRELRVDASQAAVESALHVDAHAGAARDAFRLGLEALSEPFRSAGGYRFEMRITPEPRRALKEGQRFRIGLHWLDADGASEPVRICYPLAADVSKPKTWALAVLTDAKGQEAGRRAESDVASRPTLVPLRVLDFSVQPTASAGRPAAVATWLTSRPASTQLQFGPTPKYGSESPLDAHCAVAHRVVLGPLSERGVYHARAVSVSKHGDRATSSDVRVVAALPTRPAEPVGRASVALTVRDEAGVARDRAPVCSGVPLKAGALFSPEHVRVVHAGREVQSQAEVWSRWPDGSVRWLLVQFQARVAAKGSGAYALEYGREVRRQAASSPLRVKQEVDRIVVVTGPMRAAINTARFNLFDSVSIDADKDGKFDDSEAVVPTGASRGLAIQALDGRVYRADLAKPRRVEIEERGPVRAVVRVVGDHAAEDGAKLFEYDVRLHFYAGDTCVRVFHTFTNTWPKSQFARIRSLRLHTAVRVGDAARVEFGESASAQPMPLAKGDRAALLQDSDDHYAVSLPGHMRAGRRSQGWAAVTGPHAAVCAGVRNFWQLYPKALSVSQHELVVELCPDISAVDYASRDRQVLLYWNLDREGYVFKQGMTKRHEVCYEFAAGVDRLGERLTDLLHPPMAAAPAEHYCASGAFMDIVPVHRQRFGLYEDNVKKGFAVLLTETERFKEYGMMNYGDTCGEAGPSMRTRMWNNTEYDLAHTLLLQFARCGDLRYFRRAEIAARHNMDVDHIHFHTDPERVGQVYGHSDRHSSSNCGETPGDWANDRSRSSGRNGHTWVEGLYEYAFLTGDRRALEVANQTSDSLARLTPNHPEFSGERVPGWILVALAGAYRDTLDPFYLKACKPIVCEVLRRLSPDRGLWTHRLPQGHCNCGEPHYGGCGFMMGVLLSGLKRYHELSGDAGVAECIVAASRGLVADMWDPAVLGFRYTSCPHTTSGPFENMLISEGYAYACGLSGDAGMKDYLAQMLVAAARVSAPGTSKPLAMYARVAPHTLAALSRLGLPDQPFAASSQRLHEAMAANVRAALRRGMDQPTTELFLRFPATKEVLVLDAEDKQFTVSLTFGRCGSIEGEAPAGLAEVFAPSGKRLEARSFDNAESGGLMQFCVPQDGERGAYKIRITGNVNSFWNPHTSLPKLVVHVPNGQDFTRGHDARLFFHVPKDAEQFEVHLRTGKSAVYGALILDPNGAISAQQVWQGMLSPKGKFTTEPTATKVFRLRPRPELRGKLWSVAFQNANDLSIVLKHVPPYLARRPEEFFLPPRQGQ